MARELGQWRAEGIFIPLSLETCIRIMSRWGKEGVVGTEKDGFLVMDVAGLEGIGLE